MRFLLTLISLLAISTPLYAQSLDTKINPHSPVYHYKGLEECVTPENYSKAVLKTFPTASFDATTSDDTLTLIFSRPEATQKLSATFDDKGCLVIDALIEGVLS